ncbi:MAG: UPF0104 family protein [Deltaproteobacteria bacterium]|nr:MAG: UPF0104 family protein [Deltaproteobacteria bacterium]
MKKPRLKMFAAWGLGLLLLFLLFIVGDGFDLIRLPEPRWGSVFLVFLFTVGFTIAHNFRWREIIESLSPTWRGEFFSLYRSLTDSYAIGKIIPMDLSLLGVRSYYLNRVEKLSFPVAVFSVLFDRFMDVVIFLLMALPSFLLIAGIASSIQSVSILVLLLLGQSLLICWKKGETFHYLFSISRVLVFRWVSKIPILGNRVKRGIEQAGDPAPFTLHAVIKIMAWNYVKYFFLSLRFYFTGRALGIPLPLLETFFFLPFVQLSGLINVTPGGIGVVEAGTYGALLLMGISKSQILIFVVGQRVLLIGSFGALFVLNRFFYFVRSKWRGEEGFSWK